MGERDVTHDELRRLLAEQSTTLVKAMVDTNHPLEKRIDALTDQLRELNGKVYHHALALSKGGERMDGLRDDIARIDRRIYERRKEDKQDPADTGEKRRLTMWDVYVFLSAVAASVAVLKLFGRLGP